MVNGGIVVVHVVSVPVHFINFTIQWESIRTIINVFVVVTTNEHCVIARVGLGHCFGEWYDNKEHFEYHTALGALW